MHGFSGSDRHYILDGLTKTDDLFHCYLHCQMNFGILKLAIIYGVRAVEKINYPILLVFCTAFFVAMKRTYLDMLTSSRLECGSTNII